MQNIFDVLGLFPAAVVIGVLVLGLLIGSFLNVVIYRLPKMMEAEWRQQRNEVLCTEPAKAEETTTINPAFPSSQCPVCGHQIRAWENIPVISYLFLRGKCSACKTPISLRYPAIELVTGILSAVVIYFFGLTYAGFAALVFTWCLIALTMIDVDTQLL